MACVEKFRFDNQRVHLTYKSHLDKEAFKSWCKEDLGALEIHIAHETGHEDTPYDHSHVIVEWGRRFQTKTSRRFDYNGIHPHIKPITSREQLEHTYKYLAKEDKTCQYLLEKQSTAFAKRVWSCKSLQEALSTVDEPREVLGTIAMYSAKPKPEAPRRTITEFRPWQEKLMRMLADEPDDRHIIWVKDTKGSAGKSRLAAHIEDTGMGICFSGSAGIRDISHIISKEIDSGTSLRVIIMDLSRSFKDRDIYNVLECLKNGRITAGKYDSKRLAWRPGHVVVFANFPPDRGAFSYDRIIMLDLDIPTE